MNYQKSSEILERVKAVDTILLSCHHHPDSDTVGASVTLAKIFKGMGKTVKIICPDKLPPQLKFIEGSEEIETHKFEDFNFNEWQLYIVADTSSWSRLFIKQDFQTPQISVIVIDNHTSNTGFGEINLLDYKTSSVCEMLYLIYQDWEVSLDRQMATALLAGICGDTGSFQYEVHTHTFEIAAALTKLGANSNVINYHLFENKPLALIKFWGLAIQKLVVDPAGFAYVAIPFDEYNQYKDVYESRESTASLIVAKVAEAKFGFILTEEQPRSCSVSFRSRTNIDTAKIAATLGGGGHPAASGAWLRDISFEEALEKVLTLCQTHAKT